MASGMKRLRVRARDVEKVDVGLVSALGAAPDETDDQAARRHLGALFGAASVPSMSLTAASTSRPPELEYESSTEEALTHTKQVSYQQKHHSVPVHGGRVGVELTQQRALIGVDGHIADVGAVDTVPTLSEDDARKRVEELLPAAKGSVTETPKLVIRFDDARSRWTLAYVFENVELAGATQAGPQRLDGLAARKYRFFVDAHSGEEIVRIPQVRHATIEGKGTDKSGKEHRFSAKRISEFELVLADETRKITTTSIDFKAWDALPSPLPGAVVKSPSATFGKEAAVAAHAYASQVYDFFANVLKRNGIDGKGGAIHSAVDCVPAEANPGKVWRNAAWLRHQHPELPEEVHAGMMIYGQVLRDDGQLVSIAEGLEVVGHELTHGVTDYTAGLEYVTESGALNESYSDIFGALIANRGKSVDEWDWSFGGILNSDGKPIRDLKNPEAHGQPDHTAAMEKLQPGELPNEFNDHGFVHVNSGVHNKAAFELISANVFSEDEIAQLYYLTLSTPGRLGPTSGFADSRDGLVASCESLFRELEDEEIERRVNAIREAFAKVGL